MARKRALLLSFLLRKDNTKPYQAISQIKQYIRVFSVQVCTIVGAKTKCRIIDQNEWPSH